MKKEKKEKREKKVTKKTAIFGIGIFVVCAVALFVMAVYARYDTDAWAQKSANVLRLPVMVTLHPFSVLTAEELQWKLRSIRQFYEKQDFASLGMRVDFTTEDGKKRLKIRERGLFNKEIEDRVIENLANASDIRVTDTEVDQSVARKLHEFGSEESVKSDLVRLYGWSLDDFKREVVKPEIYKTKMTNFFAQQQDKHQDDLAKEKITEAQKELNAGVAFADSVKKYSEGATTESGGDIGWIDISQAEPNLAEAIEGLSVGKRSEIIETSLGYHIVLLNETRKESGITLYRVSQIITRKETLADLVSASIREASVWTILPEYVWNAESGYVEFSDPEMIEFEKKSTTTPASSS